MRSEPDEGPPEIREAAPEELHVVLAILRAAFTETAATGYPSSALLETLDDIRAAVARGGAILALAGGRPIGSARFAVDCDAGFLAYARLAVHPGARGHGYGLAMVDWLEAHARSLGLFEVRADARSAMPDNRPFYLARGYEIIGYEDRYGVEGLRTRMRKTLTDPELCPQRAEGGWLGRRASSNSGRRPRSRMRWSYSS